MWRGLAHPAAAGVGEVRMMRSLLRALLLWLGALDAAAALGGLRGLSWGGRWAGPLLGLAALIRGGRPRPLGLLAALPLAGALQIGLATLRQRSLNPLDQLRPGGYADRQIARLDLPGPHGPVPALHVVPRGGARAAVLVAHGSGCDKTFYAWRLADALVARGLAGLFIDLDGHGESPRPQSFPQIVGCVAGPAEWLAARYERVGVLGMSLGGAVAARAVAEGARCDALAIWEAPPRLRLSAQAYRQVQLAEARRILRPQLAHLFRDGSLWHVVRAWRTSGIRATIGTWDLFDTLDLLGSLDQTGRSPDRPPLLLYYAGNDAVVPRSMAEEVRAATAGWAEWRLVPGASHISLPIELKVFEGTAEWLAQQLGLSASRSVRE